jgi:hypothetical protein
MRKYDSLEEQFSNHAGPKEVLEILQNLGYMTSLDADSPVQARLNIRMMEGHLHNLYQSYCLLVEPRGNSILQTVSL